MQNSIPGIHHVTAIAGDPQANIDFYAGILGLRLVKLTVNFDDPTTYHLYYGDGQGHPGTILTFFPWPQAMRGRIGTGQVTVTSLAVPDRALDFWERYLQQRGVDHKREQSLFEREVLSLRDPDGLQLELVSTPDADPDRVWEHGPVPPEYGIRGFHHVTLTEVGYERTAELLTDTMGFRLIESKENRFRYSTQSGSGSKTGTIVDVICAPAGRSGLIAVGTVHHVAWRTSTNDEQVEWRKTLTARHYDVTPVIDRKYFHSTYFREPGGVLFEIATDPPGFAVDERAETLGSHLVLPAWLEPHRAELQKALPKVRLPQAKAVSA
ncbi:MAG TPA: ring-cleaving dioxygenase [Bryobacteraceae bacterium]|nr:ring-cleaving dioxygenase [Bryobacteraceae bacterium]